MPTAAAKPASTVVILHDATPAPEIFLVRRGEGMAFMGGAHVFPGGRVDPADRDTADPAWCDGVADAARHLADLPPREAVAYHLAAARELFEEAGVLLARDGDGRFVSLADPAAHDRFKRARGEVHAGSRTLRNVVEDEHLRLALDALTPFAHWVTPPIDVRQFDTRFFLSRVPPEQTPAHDAAETIASVWLTAADALIRCSRDEIALPPPTWTTLRELEPFRTVDEALAWARRRTIARRQPAFVEENGKKMLLLANEPTLRETRFVLANGRWRAEVTRA
jgi:8-oxo-dGTP pyrophosphatase MutT (NUDIX family)